MLCAVAEYSAELAQAVVDSGDLDALVTSLEELDSGVKESVAWILGYIGHYNGQLADAVEEAGALPSCASRT